MGTVIPIASASDFAPFAQSPLLRDFDLDSLKAHAVDATLLVIDGDEPRARCSLWWCATPVHGAERIGAVGHYAALDDASAHLLLEHAGKTLAAQGCTQMVGPMDGNTWRRYRFVTDRGTEPPFFLEPDNSDACPAQFTAAGFLPLAGYYSALNTDLTQHDARLDAVALRLEDAGVRLRALDADRFESELTRIYDVSLASFAKNFLYTPIAQAEFVLQYRKVMPYLRPGLSLLAEGGGHTLGFVFALPDLLQAQRGVPIDTVIVKTVAVQPDRRHAGLGALLVARVQEAAATLGYTRAIHALMHESNTSRNISAHYAQPMRKYTLYMRPLRA